VHFSKFLAVRQFEPVLNGSVPVLFSSQKNLSVRFSVPKKGGENRTSVCKSGLVTGKRPEPDRTRTCQDCKLVGPVRTVTAVRSTVHHKFEDSKTEKRPVQPVLTGLSSSKSRLVHGHIFSM